MEAGAKKFCIKKVKKNNDLPLDVLGIIYRKLDFGDLFKFAGVCKSWRITHKHYLTSFMEFQSPFIVEITAHAKKVCSFYSIPDLKIHRFMMPNFWGSSYCASSSGYMILAGKNTLLLMNPFTRKEQVISTSAIKDTFDSWSCRALLAFAKGSEEFVIVISSCKYSFSHDNQPWSLNVYQSRNSCWVTYSIGSDPWKVVDFVVLHNTIYALTDKAEIGVLSLNSARVKFIDLKNTPHVTSTKLRLVTCDGQLLMVHFVPAKRLNVYKVDFSTMEYVKLESLGDIALFFSERDCYALSNPGRWGYDNNSLYHLYRSPIRRVYSWNNELKKCMVPGDFGAPVPKGKSKPYWVGWYFQHLHNEVDYSELD